MRTVYSSIWLIFNLCRYGLIYSVRRLNEREKSRDALRGELLCSFLIATGPVFIKIGQILSTRSDLLPAKIINHLQKLQDDVPAMSVSNTRKTLRNAYDGLDIFAAFSQLPISSASIAQVHCAKLRDGTSVAVKIVKRGVDEQLQSNLSVLSVLARLADFFVPSIRPMQIPARIADLRTLLLQQADMLQEAEAMSKIRENFNGHPYVIVPKTYPKLCRRDVLVMEYCTGIPGRQAASVATAPHELSRRLIEIMQTMIYVHGFFHADAHPGNVQFTSDGKVILLDFGITEQLTEAEKWALSSFYYAVLRKEWKTAAARYTRAFVVDRTYIDQHWEQYEREMTSCLRKHFDSAGGWNTAEFTQDTIRIFEKFRTRESTKWVKIELALVSLEGFVAQIDPEVDIWEVSRKFNDRYSLYLSDNVKEVFDEYNDHAIPASLQAECRASRHLVAPTHLHRYFVPANYPLFVKKAYGATFEDLDGRRYIELHGGYGPFVLGYAHPVVEKAVKNALAMGNVCALSNMPEVELMELLVEAVPSAEKGLFTNSGTEACHVAINLCKAYRRQQTVAKCEGHYHGFSDQGTVSGWFRVHGPTDRPMPIGGSAGVSPAITESTVVLQYGRPEALEQIREASTTLACVIVEPMPASMVKYDRDWLAGLRDVCTETGVPLIFDEVVTGFRVAYGGMQDLLGITPDVTVLGKIIGGGLPCGGVVGKEPIINMAKSTGDPFRDYEERIFTGGTLSGNALTCAAGLAQLQVLKDNPEIYEKLEKKTDWLVAELSKIAQEHNAACKINGVRSLFSMSFRRSSPRYYREKYSGSDVRANIALAYFMRQYGVYMAELHTYFLSAAHTQEDLKMVAAAFSKSLEKMRHYGLLGD